MNVEGSHPGTAAGPACVCIVDLTASTGLSALRSVLPQLTADGPWLGLPIPGMPAALALDWHRPARATALRLGASEPLAQCVLVGPGAASQLPALLPLLASTGARETVFMLLPNALVEWHWLQQNVERSATGAGPSVLQLPNSDTGALWMILLEQIDNVLRRHAASLPPPTDPLPLHPMSSNLKQSMDQAMTIEGAVAVALVDHRSGMCLAQAGGGMNLDLAAAGNSEVVRAKLRTIEALGLRNSIEDILITLQHQYHLIRLIPSNAGLFLYLALDRQRGNLALARYKLTEIERALKV